MAGGTVVSRVTGFARTAALAAVLGLSVTADAYSAATSVPTMLLVLVTGGTLSAAIVPLLAEPETAEVRRRVAGSVLVAVAALSGLGSVLLLVLSPAVARLLSLAASPAQAAEREQQTALLLALASPQVLLLGVLVATNAVLTAAGRLGRVGFTPVLNNVLALAGIGAYAAAFAGSRAQSTEALLVLGGSSTLALAVASTSQLYACRDLLPRSSKIRDALDRSVLRRLVAVGRWSVLYVVANQFGLLAVLVVAGRATGAVAAYQWSFTVMQLPYAVLAVPLLSAVVPRLTRLREHRVDFRGLTSTASQLLLVLVLPAAAGLVVFADVAAMALLARAGGDDVEQLTTGIRWFGAALLPFATFQLLTRLAYVLDRPAWPALVNVAVNATTAGGAVFALFVPSDDSVVEVLAVSYGLSYVVGTVVMSALVRRVPWRSVMAAHGLQRSVALTLLATVAAVACRAAVDGWAGTATAAGLFAVPALAALWPWRRVALRSADA